MKVKLKNKWLKALRSGEYKQCKLSLRQGEAFCVFGVLADVMGCEWKGNCAVDGDYLSYYGIGINALKKAGISEDKEDMLMLLNDYKGRSFKQMASYIERYL